MNRNYLILSKLRVCCLLVAVMWGLNLSAQTEQPALILGNHSGNPVTFQPVSNPLQQAGSALYYPETYMAAYKGCTLTEIQVNLHARPQDRGTLKVFLTHHLNEPPFYEQTLLECSRGWNRVALSQPYVIDGRPLYIGYEVSGEKYLSYSEAFVKNEEWVKHKDEGWVKYTGVYSAALYAIVTGSSLPRHNVRLVHVKMPAYTLTATNVAYKGSVSNLGVEPINSLTVNYLVDGKQARTERVENLNIAPRKSGTFALEGLHFETEGNYRVQLEVAAVNGEPDAVTADNLSMERTTVCRNEFARRKALLEVFSTERCSNCPQAHKSIAQVLEKCSDYVEIGHHAGFLTDKFTLDESVKYEWFYTPTHGNYAPAMMFDRTNFSNSYPSIYSDQVAMVSGSGDYAAKLIDEALAIPAFASVQLAGTVDNATRELRLQVSGKQLLDLPEAEGKPVLNVWITEDNIFSKTQMGAKGSYTHRHVARRCLTPVWGQPIDNLQAGYAANFQTVLPEDWDMRNLRAIAFVSLYNPDDRNGCQVLNAEELLLKKCVTSVESVTTNHVNEPCDVYAVDGTCVLRGATPGQIRCLPRGVYIINGQKVVR